MNCSAAEGAINEVCADVPAAGRAAPWEPQSAVEGAEAFPIAALRMAENCRLPETPPARSFAATELFATGAAESDGNCSAEFVVTPFLEIRCKEPDAIHPIRILSAWFASLREGNASSADPDPVFRS